MARRGSGFKLGAPGSIASATPVVVDGRITCNDPKSGSLEEMRSGFRALFPPMTHERPPTVRTECWPAPDDG
jgi:hypothetical protein